MFGFSVGGSVDFSIKVSWYTERACKRKNQRDIGWRLVTRRGENVKWTMSKSSCGRRRILRRVHKDGREIGTFFLKAPAAAVIPGVLVQEGDGRCTSSSCCCC